jgi:hypothetical protein
MAINPEFTGIHDMSEASDDDVVDAVLEGLGVESLGYEDEPEDFKLLTEVPSQAAEKTLEVEASPSTPQPSVSLEEF